MAKPGLDQTFGKLIKKYRVASKMSQETLAERADVHPTYIGLLERGRRTAGLGVAGRIARALGKRLSQLIAETE
jgi:transcriptional regulator with XRE-family HTH domain